MDPTEIEIDLIRRDVKRIKDELIEKKPEHFSKQDAVRAFFGATIVGLTFVFKGLLVEIGINIPWKNVIMVIASTMFILSTEIYFIGYTHVKNKRERPFGQFYIKRLLSVYTIAITVSFFLCYIFGIIYLVDTLEQFMKIVLLISMPCSIGAAVGNLLKKY